MPIAAPPASDDGTDDVTYSYRPAGGADRARAKPVYEEVPGGEEDTSGARRFEELPENARAYIRRIEQLLDAPVHLVSVGPEREQAIAIKPVI